MVHELLPASVPFSSFISRKPAVAVRTPPQLLIDAGAAAIVNPGAGELGSVSTNPIPVMLTLFWFVIVMVR